MRNYGRSRKVHKCYLRINDEKKEYHRKGSNFHQTMDYLTAVQSQDFSKERCTVEGKGKEVQIQLLIPVL